MVVLWYLMKSDIEIEMKFGLEQRGGQDMMMIQLTDNLGRNSKCRFADNNNTVGYAVGPFEIKH